MNYESKLKELVKAGSEMRTAQQEYFKRISKARKTKLPDDFDSANRALCLSKELEWTFDTILHEIEVEQQREVVNG